jgi:protein-histidine pros-kinase
MNWRRFDTLGLRLFLLMWLVLVLSHLVAYAVALPLLSGGGAADVAQRLKPQNLPTLTSLPPRVRPSTAGRRRVRRHRPARGLEARPLPPLPPVAPACPPPYCGPTTGCAC